MVIAQVRRSACADAAKPVAAIESNAKVTTNDFSIFVTPDLHVFTRRAP
jgi:hypothetical protein